MPNTRSPTGWYYCSYLLRLTLAGSPSAQDPEARFLSYENTVLIRADSSLEAYDKTLRIVWGRYYFDTFIDKAKKGEIFKGNKILNKNSGKIGFDTFSFKVGRK